MFPVGGELAGDFTHSGHTSLLLPTSQPGMDLFLDDEDGSFHASSNNLVVTPLISYNFAGSAFYAADFNGDGNLDLMIPGYYDTTSTPSKIGSFLVVFLGDGSFTDAPGYPISAGNIIGPQAVKTAAR